MMATINSVLVAVVGLLAVPVVYAQTTAAGERLTQFYRQHYLDGKKRWQTETNSVEAAWVFARACFDWGELAEADPQRAERAQEGIAAARHAIALDPKSAQGLHYLALNLGQLARTKRLGALKLVQEMEASWKQSIALDPKFEFAGAHRSLGVLYRDAPGWPTSLGDRSKARFHLKKAVELFPGYPDNPLTLMESYLNWGDKKSALALAGGFEAILRKARQELTGDQWALSWGDWRDRWGKVKAKTSVVTARSPRMEP